MVDRARGGVSGRVGRWVLALVASLVVAVAPAKAQFGMGMSGEAMDVSVSRRALDAMGKILGLDKDQKEAALALFEGYKNDYKAAQDKMQAGMKAIQEKVADTQDFTLFQKEMPKLGREFGEKSRALEKSFMSDVKASLNDAQLAKWTKVEQYRRREQFMRIGAVSGAAVDLIRVSDRAKAAPKDHTEFDALLERYESEMDKHLIEMERVQKESEEKMMSGEGGMFDMGRIQEIFKSWYAVGKDMRETNKEYTRKLGLLMDDPARERFEQEVNQRAFPRVYKQAHVLKMMEAAEKLPDLDKAKKEEIQGMRAAYVRDVASANEKWSKAIEERDDKGGGTFAVMMASMQGGNQDLNKDVNSARQVRKELDSKAKDKLEAMLTEDQKAKLPPAPAEQRGNPWADFMPEPEEDSPEAK